MADTENNVGGEDLIPDLDTEDTTQDTTQDTGEQEDTQSGEDQDGHGDDAQNAELPGTEPNPQPSAGRASRRIQALEKERDEERRHSQELQRRLEDTLAAAQARLQGVDPERARQEREAKLAVMEPYERDAYLQNERIANLEQQLKMSALNSQDSEDRIRFDVKAESNPVYAKYKGQVEEKVQELRAKGIVAQRDAVLKFMIGEAALAKMAGKRGNPKPAVSTSERVSSARGNSPSARSDASGSRKGSSLEERLANVAI